MKANFKHLRIATLLVASLMLAFFSAAKIDNASAGTPGSVIINELMYNPVSGNQLDEYIELYNTTGSPIDISGWSFSAGVTFTFAPATTIPANGYFLISPSAGSTLSTYGISISQVYTGALSNGGEAITLVDETLQTIDTVTYDDVSPWPESSDGSGPSLELKDPNTDNTVATNWGASVGTPTPLAQNSWIGLDIPTVTNVNDPNNITDADTVNITATVTDEVSVELSYKVNFDADVTVAMLDDGLSNDGSAGDGVYGASIPAQSAGDLVRFKVRAIGVGADQYSPSLDDAMDYHGYTVQNPAAVYDSTKLSLFISDFDYNDMLTNHVFDNVYVPAVVAYGNDVYDNSKVRIRGDARTYLKHPLKVKLPSGSLIDVDGGSSIAIDEFELLNAWWDTSAILPGINWMTEQTGLPTADIIPVAVEKNAEFHGLFMFANKYQKEWRQANGYSDGELYEDSNEIISGTDSGSNLVLHESNTLSLTDINLQSQKDYILDSFDIPKTFNFMAAIGLVQGYDHYRVNNTLQYLDNTTGRWSGLLWDQGGIFAGRYVISPYNSRGVSLANCPNYCPVYNQPELRELYLRRFKTLVDKIYSSDALLNKFIELDGLYANDMAMDLAKWGPIDTINARDIDLAQLTNQYYLAKEIYLRGVFPWGLPPSQTDLEREQVYIEQANYDANPAEEYIKISSTADTPVDISNWYIEGINYEIPAGSVVPANGSIYILKNDLGYKAAHSPVLVAGQYPNSLGSLGGQLVLKTDTNVEIDVYDY